MAGDFNVGGLSLFRATLCGPATSAGLRARRRARGRSFTWSWRLPNNLSRHFAEGLSTRIIPAYAHVQRKEAGFLRDLSPIDLYAAVSVASGYALVAAGCSCLRP